MSFAPPGYSAARIGQARVIARSDVLSFVRDAITSGETLYEYAASQPHAEAISGRQTVYAIPGPNTHRWILRHLSHGGWLASLTRDRFLRVGLPRPFNELRVAWQLREIGIPTPEVVAAAIYTDGIVYRGDIARQEVSPARDLANCLFSKPDLTGAERTATLAAAGRLVRRLHRAGVIHPDLNLRNILIESVSGSALAYILDVEKCRTVAQVPRWRRREMLQRLKRSARKFERREGRQITDEEWRRFHSAYADPDDGDE